MTLSITQTLEISAILVVVVFVGYCLSVDDKYDNGCEFNETNDVCERTISYSLEENKVCKEIIKHVCVKSHKGRFTDKQIVTLVPAEVWKWKKEDWSASIKYDLIKTNCKNGFNLTREDMFDDVDFYKTHIIQNRHKWCNATIKITIKDRVSKCEYHRYEKHIQCNEIHYDPEDYK